VLTYIGLAGLDEEFTLPKHVGAAARDVIIAAAWTGYMFRSERVRATFRARLPSGATEANST